MQIKLYTFLLLLLAAVGSNAQTVDTVLFQNFETEPLIPWSSYPFGDDTTWVNCDADGLTPNDFDTNHYTWFFAEQSHVDPDSNGYVNTVMSSLSWMDGFAVGNRNWLISPPIQITDNTYTLHWKAAPYQAPRYMDGYSVRVSTGSNDILNPPNPFTDTLFRAASMEEIIGNDESIDISNFTFTPGYFFADSLTNWDYIDIWDVGDSTLLRGFLQPQSVSLAAYAGQTIYFAIVHDSDDDFYIDLDDILVTKSTGSSAHNAKPIDLRFVTYPNPVQLQLNVMYRLPESAAASLRIVDMNGRTVREVYAGRRMPAGEQSHQLWVADLVPGAYTVVLEVEGNVVSRMFTKG